MGEKGVYCGFSPLFLLSSFYVRLLLVGGGKKTRNEIHGWMDG